MLGWRGARGVSLAGDHELGEGFVGDEKLRRRLQRGHHQAAIVIGFVVELGLSGEPQAAIRQT